MKLSASIELVWQVAVQEAIAAEFAELEPEHFLAALLKFAELPVNDLPAIAQSMRVAQELSVEIRAIQRELNNRSIDSTEVRRRLRDWMGKGGCPYDGSQKHRSKSSRDLFDSAGRLADDTASDVLSVGHLLSAIFAAPTPAIRAVLPSLDAVPKQAAVEPVDLPLLGERGVDMVRMAAERQLSGSTEPSPACRVLVRLLSDAHRPSVLLVTDDEKIARTIVDEVAGLIASSTPPQEIVGRRMFDLTGLLPSGQCEPDGLEGLDSVMTEAAAARDVILFVPAVVTRHSPGRVNPWLDLLKSRVIAGSVQLICRVSSVAFERWIKRDRDWKPNARLVWLQRPESDTIPLEL